MKPCLLILTAWLVAGSAGADTLCFIGTALSLSDNHTLYTEQYEDIRDETGKPESTRVRYLTADGSRLADKYLQYGNHPYAPDVTFVNHLTGYQEQLEWQADGKVRLSYQERHRPPHHATLAVTEPVVADAGFNVFLQEHLPQLAAGETLHFHFLNPARLSWYRFSAQGKPLANGDLEVRIKPESLLLRWLVQPIALQYSRQDKRLLEYRGQTNISLEGDQTLQARIEYNYRQKPIPALSRATAPLQYDHCDFEG